MYENRATINNHFHALSPKLPISLMLSSLVSTAIITLFTVINPEKFLHWFVVPVWLCGLIVGIDAMRWLSNKIELFDPVGIIGVYGFYFFFLSPLLHVYFDYWMPRTFIIPPKDWRDWIGLMAFLNFLGLLGYKFATKGARWRNRFKTKAWIINNYVFWPLLTSALIFTGGLQIWIYYQFGGLWGYIAHYEERLLGSVAFRGWGIWFMISESFPILFFMAYILISKHRKKLQNTFFIILTLVVFVMLKILFGGLRGSRSDLIFALIWAVGAVHFSLRPIAKRAIYLVFVLILGFMYFYGFYKGAGSEVFSLLSGESKLYELEQKTGRNFLDVLLGDLGRTDVQAFLLYRIVEGGDYELAYGRTYLGAAALLIPRAIWPDRPPTKVKEGTEAQYGKGSYIADRFESSKVYGLAGETLLNFGPLAVAPAFVLWGVLVKWVRNFVYTLGPEDARRLIAPWLITFCLVVLIGDSDNILFFIAKNLSISIMILWIGRKHIPNLAE